MPNRPPARPKLRIFCVEDNPLIILHLEMLIQELGHLFVGSSDSFTDLRRRIDELNFDVALVDFDLADGPSGGEVAAWLRTRNRPAIFVTGQEYLAAEHAEVAAGLIVKPVTSRMLERTLQAIPLNPA